MLLGMYKIDLTGRRFGTWTVISFSRNADATFWNCRCDCGVEREVRAGLLSRGSSTNCGCQRKHVVKHGHSRRGKRTRTYRIWKAMHSRVKPAYVQARDYFARGISVCDRWSDYESFLSDMGEAPDGLSIDRIDNDGNYEPQNCRWATAKTQRENSRRIVMVELNGRLLHLKDAASEIGITDTAVYNDRKRHGGSLQDAFARVLSRRA